MATPFSSAGRTVNKYQINYATVGGGSTAPTYQTSKDSTVNPNNSIPVWKIDMGRENHFTVEISGIGVPNMKIKLSPKENSSTYNFLPIKSFSYTPVSLEHLSLNAGLFTDIPIPQYRKVGRIELEVLDTVDHYYENSFFSWYASTVPDYLGYVGYLADSVRTLTYREFNNVGNNIVNYVFEVIPDGDVKVSRSYDGDNIKSVSITLVIVGIVSTTSSLYKRVSATQNTEDNPNTVPTNIPKPVESTMPMYTAEQAKNMSIAPGTAMIDYGTYIGPAK